VGDGVRVPAFREHRDRDHAADRAAKLAGLAYGVHDLAEQFLVRDILARTNVARGLHHFASEPIDFIGGHAAKIVVERIAGFELLAIDQQRVGTRQRIAGCLVEIAKQRVSSVVECRGAVVVLPMEAGDEVVDELRDRGVLANDDEAGS
jgi:hypothetical protein